MNQPYDPYYDQNQNGYQQPQYPAQQPYPGPSPYGQQPAYGSPQPSHGGYGEYGGYGAPPPPGGGKSKLPVIIAAVAVVLVAAAVVLFFVLRDDKKSNEGDGPDPEPSTSVTAEDAEEVAQEFLAAADDKDADALKSVTSGVARDEIDSIVEDEEDLNLTSGDYHQDTEITEVEDGHIAIVYWELVVDGESGVLAGLMYAEQDGDGFKVCNIDAQAIADVDQLTTLQEWEQDYKQDCA